MSNKEIPETKQLNKTLVHFPAGMLAEIDAIAKHEYRTRSDLLREMARRYIDAFKRGETQRRGAKLGILED